GRRDPLDRLSGARLLHSGYRHEPRPHPAAEIRCRDRSGDANERPAGDLSMGPARSATTSAQALRSVSPHELKAMLQDGGELAILDVREELIFSRAHLLWARSVPLSRLELLVASRVPRRDTRLVLCDDADGLAARAADVLRRFGYSDLAFLS